jgi:hypothetical protein
VLLINLALRKIQLLRLYFRNFKWRRKYLGERDIQHNCPICGRPVNYGKGYVCKKCGKKYLCSLCVDDILDSSGFNVIFCIECLRKMGISCNKFGCNRKFSAQCIVCNKKWCNEHAQSHLVLSELEGKTTNKFSFYCSNCRGYVCRSCLVKKKHISLRTSFCCAICGTKLKKIDSNKAPSIDWVDSTHSKAFLKHLRVSWTCNSSKIYLWNLSFTILLNCLLSEGETVFIKSMQIHCRIHWSGIRIN